MKKTGRSVKKTRTRYSEEFKQEALALAQRLGVAKAAAELGLADSQLYGWRQKSRQKQDRSELEKSQATEIARLKRELSEKQEELAILKKAAAYFAKESR